MMLSVSLCMWIVVAVTQTAGKNVDVQFRGFSALGKAAIDSPEEAPQDVADVPSDLTGDDGPALMTAAFPGTKNPPMALTEGDYLFGFTCPDGFTMYSTQCLLYVPQTMGWNEAKENCHSKGSFLASVFLDSQATEVHDEMRRAGETSGKVWVGGHTSPEDVTWSWDGSSYFNGVGHFCDEDPHVNNCLEITADDNSECLDDMDCDMKLPSVCGTIIM